MGRPRNRYPVPRTETRSDRPGRYYISWSFRRKIFRVALGEVTPETADLTCTLAALALQGAGAWPDIIADAPAVLKWEQREALQVDASLLEAYREFVRGDVSRAWAATSVAYVKKLLEQFPDPLVLTAKEAHSFFSEMTKGQAAGTRNKKLQAMTKFYAYLQRTHHLHRSPFAGIKYVKERHSRNADIVYLSTKERSHILKVAAKEQLGIAAWLGICMGMRQKEIFDAEWRDINWRSETIHLPETKTRTPRTIPLPTALLPMLRKHKKKKGLIVPWSPSERTYKTTATALLKRLRVARGKVPADHISFNPFRHTFASHLVQAGVSLSKVAYYLGDTEKTAQERYSRFIPKDKKDRDIDKGFA